MRLTAPLIFSALGLVAAPAAAQDDGRRILAREVARDVVREVMEAVRPGAYQGRNNGPEQTERFSRKVKIGRDGRFSLSNIAGDIIVTAGSGDEVSIEAIATTEQSELDPRTAATLQKNLAVIDQAISESRAAVRSEPASEPAQQSLIEGFKTKIGLLQDTVALINEMRKGNEAGAARIVSGLKQKGN